MLTKLFIAKLLAVILFEMLLLMFTDEAVKLVSNELLLVRLLIKELPVVILVEIKLLILQFGY